MSRASVIARAMGLSRSLSGRSPSHASAPHGDSLQAGTDDDLDIVDFGTLAGDDFSPGVDRTVTREVVDSVTVEKHFYLWSEERRIHSEKVLEDGIAAIVAPIRLALEQTDAAQTEAADGESAAADMLLVELNRLWQAPHHGTGYDH